MTASTDWRHLYPFESHWTEIHSGRMHYLDEGPRDPSPGTTAETLLFVHGNPTWSFHWRRLILALRGQNRCVAPDHMGCGLSDKGPRNYLLATHIENLCVLVERLGLERVTLVAQDWGGAIGLGAMIQMRQRLERIILFNTGAFPPHYIPWRIRACRMPVFGRLGLRGANLFSRAALRMTLSRRARLEPEVAAGYVAPYDTWANRVAVESFVRDIPTSPREGTWRVLADMERRLPTLADLPIALIWGMQDWCFRPDCLERFRAAWPSAEVHKLQDVGHWVVEDAPDESLQIVQRFLKASTAEVGRLPGAADLPNEPRLKSEPPGPSRRG